MTKISIVVPVFNESPNIQQLIDSITLQSLQPYEVILVDGGSTDDTVEKIRNITLPKLQLKLLIKKGAMPGQGRNVGTEAAAGEWIAYTDAGIKLDSDWLLELNKVREGESEVDIIYGNVIPIVRNFFEKAACISYTPSSKKDMITMKFIASCMIKKQLWKEVGGFPDYRAAEDLIFMEKAEIISKCIGFAPKAIVHWELRKELASTFKKFYLYSAYNVWAAKQADWHYGIARQYLLALLFVFLSIFWNGYFAIFLPVWLIARAIKRAIPHRYRFGYSVFDPRLLCMVMLILLTIDLATFLGWLKALLHPQAKGNITFR